MQRLFIRNESENNEIVSKLFIGIGAFVLLIWMFCWCGIFDFNRQAASLFAGISVLSLLVPVILVHVFHFNAPTTKYILILVLSFVVGMCYCIFTFQMIIMLILPSLVAMLYMNRKLLIFSGIVNLIAVTAAHIISAFYVLQPWLEPFMGLKDVLRFNIVPRLMQLGVCFGILVVVMNRMLAYMHQLEEIQEERLKEGGFVEETQNAEKKELEEYLARLTDREKVVFMQMLQGKTNMQIAEALCLSVGTVKNYVSSIYDKIEIRERNYLILKFGHFISDYDQSNAGL